jgi:hypothetical protein
MAPFTDSLTLGQGKLILFEQSEVQVAMLPSALLAFLNLLLPSDLLLVAHLGFTRFPL